MLGADLPITFMPHLLPLDQGELVSCYVTPSAELSEDELLNLFDDMYAREPFVELRTGPVGVIDVRDTNYCRISWHQDPRTGRIIVFSAIDNLWKGAASQAVQNLNLMFDRPETEGSAVSRWLEMPAHVTENPGDLPAGFRAAGVACGLKPSGGLDLGLMVCSAPDCVSAARFTRSGVLAAPVVLPRRARGSTRCA